MEVEGIQQRDSRFLLIHTIHKVHHNNLLNHAPDALNKPLMNRVRRHIIVPVLGRRKLRDKPMCEPALTCRQRTVKLNSTVQPEIIRVDSYLQALGRVVPSALQR